MTYAVSYREGQEALLYYGVPGATAATAIGLVSTHSPKISGNKVAGNFRDSRWENNRIGQGKLEGSFTMRRKTSDANYAALRGAAVAGTAVALKFISFAGDAANEIVDADFVISDVSTPEEMDQFQTATFDYALNIDQRAPTII